MKRLVIAPVLGLLGLAPATAQQPALAAMTLLNPARLEDVSLPAITVCNGDTQWTPPLAFAPELTTLKAARDVARGGRTLRVGRARFRNIPFNDEQTQGVSYTYVGRYEALPIALVRVVYVEGDAWVLVDPKTGAHEDVAAFPLPGPDGHTFIGATLENEYDDTGIEIVEWRDGQFKETELDVKFPCGLSWDGPDAVNLWLKTGPGNDPAVDWKAARLVRTNGAWAVEGP